MSKPTLRVVIVSGYRMSSQTACEAISRSLPVEIVLYRIPPAKWFNWLSYRIKRFGLLTLLGHISLSIYLKCRAFLLRFHRRSWDQTKGYCTPERAVRVRSERQLFHYISDADIVILMEPFRLPRSIYSRKTTTFLEVIWGTVPEFMGDSAGWWESVIRNNSITSVGLIQRTVEASDITLLASWNVNLEPQDTIGRIRLRQADVLIKKLPQFLNELLVHSTHHQKQTVKRLIGFSYISPTASEYLKYNRKKSMPNSVIDRRRTLVNYKIRMYEEK